MKGNSHTRTMSILSISPYAQMNCYIFSLGLPFDIYGYLTIGPCATNMRNNYGESRHHVMDSYVK